VLRLGVTARQPRTNLITNPSFEVNTAGWTPLNCTLAATTGSSQAGSKYLLMTISTAALAKAVSNVCVALPGTTVTVSAYMRGTAGRVARIYVTQYTGTNGTGSPVTTSGGTITLSATDQRSSYTFTMAAGYNSFTVEPGGIIWSAGDVCFVDAVLAEVAEPTQTQPQPYFDGDIPPAGAATSAWSGTAHASTSVATYQQNVLTDAPNASSSTPGSFPPGMTVWRATTAAGYPFTGILVVNRANTPVDFSQWGLFQQTLYPDMDATWVDSSKPYFRTWSDQNGWNEWTSARIKATDGKVSNDLYVGANTPAHPLDGDLWISPGNGAGAVGQVPGGYAEILASSTVNATGGLGTSDVPGLSVNVTLSSARRYKVTYDGSLIMTATAGEGTVAIKDGSTVLAYTANALSTVIRPGHVEKIVVAPTDGAHTFRISLGRVSGTGNVNVAAGANLPAFILVEDIGAA
jgi:hypothetical protein